MGQCGHSDCNRTTATHTANGIQGICFCRFFFFLTFTCFFSFLQLYAPPLPDLSFSRPPQSEQFQLFCLVCGACVGVCVYMCVRVRAGGGFGRGFGSSFDQ